MAQISALSIGTKVMYVMEFVLVFEQVTVQSDGVLQERIRAFQAPISCCKFPSYVCLCLHVQFDPNVDVNQRILQTEQSNLKNSVRWLQVQSSSDLVSYRFSSPLYERGYANVIELFEERISMLGKMLKS